MPCGCGKKKGNASLFHEQAQATGDPVVWGPALWTILHVLAEYCGNRGIDMDQARDFEVIVNHLPQVIPCEECQAHTKTYLAGTPFEAIKNAKGPGMLNPYVRLWLLTFHNAVRTQKGQSIDVTTLEQLRTLYGSETIQQCHLGTLTANVNYGIRTGLVKIATWQRWYTLLNRLKVMSGA
jgi:hypothetical protein